MLHFYKCRSASQNAGFFLLNVFFNKKFNIVSIPCRLFFKINSNEPKKVNKESESEKDYVTSIDDPKFTDIWIRRMFDISLYKTGVNVIFNECKKFYEESAELMQSQRKYRVDDITNKIEILYKFETSEDIEKFTVFTDSSFNAGCSAASLKITERETGLFSGFINKDVPKTGNIRFAGWANFTRLKQYKSFFRVKSLDWTLYTHLVFKIRGDGRTYLILLHTDVYFEEHCFMFGQQLFTRGGPYWEIVEVPLSHFCLTYKGKLHPDQTGGSALRLGNITTLGLTAGGYEGPFKLEIDYIGLVKKNYQKMHCPFEQYKPVK